MAVSLPTPTTLGLKNHLLQGSTHGPSAPQVGSGWLGKVACQ